MNIEERIKELETQLEALKAEVNKDKWPEVGMSFYLEARGSIIKSTTWNVSAKLEAMNQGSLFRTIEEAGKERDARETIAQYQRLGRRFVPLKNDHCLEAKIDFSGFCIFSTNSDGYMRGLFETYFDTEQELISAVEKTTWQKLLTAAKWRILGE